jgi:transposase InsO family protein
MEECPYTIEQFYSDNGKEYRGDSEHHSFMKLCQANNIEQRFTRVKTPRTNEPVGKLQNIIFVLFSGVFLSLVIARSSFVEHSPRSFF